MLRRRAAANADRCADLLDGTTPQGPDETTIAAIPQLLSPSVHPPEDHRQKVLKMAKRALATPAAPCSQSGVPDGHDDTAMHLRVIERDGLRITVADVEPITARRVEESSEMVLDVLAALTDPAAGEP